MPVVTSAEGASSRHPSYATDGPHAHADSLSFASFASAKHSLNDEITLSMSPLSLSTTEMPICLRTEVSEVNRMQMERTYPILK